MPTSLSGSIIRTRIGTLAFLLLAAGLCSCSGPGRGRALGGRLNAPPAATRVVWAYDAGRGIEVAPYRQADSLFVVTTDRKIQLVDATSGKRVWRKRLGGIVSGSPSVHDGVMFASTSIPDGSIYTFDLVRRKVRWKHTVGDIVGRTLYFEGTILICTRNGKVFGLSPADGKAIWATNLESPVWANTHFDTERALLLVPTRAGRLVAVDARSGEKRWTAEFDEPLSGVDVAGGRIAVLSVKGKLYQVESLNGQVRWSADVGSNVSSSPRIHGDVVAVAGLSGDVSVHRISDGAEIWRRSLGGPFRSGPAVDSGRLAVAAVSGLVWFLDLETGRTSGRVRHPETVLVSPVASDGAWIVSGERGLLTAYIVGDDS